MTDPTPLPIRYRRTDAPGVIYGVPEGDLTQADLDHLPPFLLREIVHSALYEEANTLDPLGEITDAAYEDLSPAEKGARTREANKRAEEELAAATVEVVPDGTVEPSDDADQDGE
jgi:hypothetical protein